MANNIITLDSLKKEAVRVYDSTIAVFPQLSQEEHLYVFGLIPKFNGCYATNNSTVCFVVNNEVYVAPTTRLTIRSLEAAGFIQKHFYVPFSNGDYPKAEKEKWTMLRMKADLSYAEDFKDDCINYCDQHHINAINEETLEKCFVIPPNGIMVKHSHYETCYFPILNTTCFDCIAADRIGRYNTNNGFVVFVYRNGGTYISRGYKIVDELRAAGYRKSDLFVPFSNGERILDPTLSALWASITK